MNRSGGSGEDRRERGDDGGNKGPWWWKVGVGVLGGLTVAAGAIIYSARELVMAEPKRPRDAWEDDDSGHTARLQQSPRVDNITDVVSRASVPRVPIVSNLNSLLEDIHKRYVAIKKEDLAVHYNVFMKVFLPLHQYMKEVDVYYNRYSSRVQFAGSHYDRLRITKPDEFDMDIVIGLPVNLQEDPLNPVESDIVIETNYAGFVQLRAGVQYQKIMFRDGLDCVINKKAYLWMDERKYILRSKFTAWFKSVVDRALNKFEKSQGCPSVTIEGCDYRISTSESGPAYTLRIRNSWGFALDFDLVPALRFPEKRWLGRSKVYRDIPPGCSADYWMVVPKPNKLSATSHDADRSWRVAMHDQERKLIHNSNHLRQVNRLLKKLRDTQDIRVASYHIKTLFLWKITELDDPSFWRRDVATIFKVMVKEFHKAMLDKKISYFWNKKSNMIERIPDHILKGYANKLGKLVTLLECDSNYMSAAKFLLSPLEYSIYINKPCM